MSHSPWDPTIGFAKCIRSNTTQIIRSSIIITNNYIERCSIEHALASKLVDELLRNKLISLHQKVSTENNNITFTVELIVAAPGVKMVNVNNEVFRVRNEEFNEQEIAVALKHTYPERFI